MDPINRKGKLPPIVRMQNVIASAFENREKRRSINWLGRFLPTDKAQELTAHLAANGIAGNHAYSCGTFDELSDMGASLLNIVTHPSALPAARLTKERLDQPYFPLLSGDIFADFPKLYDDICDALQIPRMNNKETARRTAGCLSRAAKSMGEWSVCISGDATHTPFSLALCLAENGFKVARVFADDVPEYENAAYTRLTHEFPETLTVQGDSDMIPEKVRDGEFYDEHCVAIGDVAAYCTGSGHFVSRLSFDGNIGFESVGKLAEETVAAKDIKRELNTLINTGRGCCAL